MSSNYTKNPVASKTIWLGLVTSLVSIASLQFPELNVLVESNWEKIGMVLGAVMIVLRGLTGRPLRFVSE